MIIRPMEPEDADSVAQIEKDSFTQPWSRQGFLCAVAVPAFAAEEVEQENCLTSSYVQMNIPYADFYKAAGASTERTTENIWGVPFILVH